jgi:phosphoribosyl 1,2-cyclic phosphodiesterase
VQLQFWGVRGSLATPERSKLRYGGNTACVELDLPEAHIVLDAGTGIRALGERLAAADGKPVHILLTHLHLDHIQGLLFFAPLFQPDREIVIWGPPATSRGHDVRTSLARYLSAPLAPIEIRDLPASVRFESCPPNEWEVPGATVRAGSILHRGLTLGFRITCGGATLAYLPDHEPGLTGDLRTTDRAWLSGTSLAEGADLLVHDGQYTSDEYEVTRGWGHSTVGDAVLFAGRCGVGRTRIFHHDPAHDDDLLDRIEALAREAAGDADVALAREGEALRLA